MSDLSIAPWILMACRIQGVAKGGLGPRIELRACFSIAGSKGRRQFFKIEKQK